MVDASQLPAFMSWPIPTEADIHEARYTSLIWAWQRGRCAMCGHTYPQLEEDHDHDTGRVRGMLCHRCNTVESYRETPAWNLWRAGMTPAVLLGDDRPYLNKRTGLPPTPNPLPPADADRRAAANAIGRIFRNGLQ